MAIQLTPVQDDSGAITGVRLADEDGFSLVFKPNREGDPMAGARRWMERWNEMGASIKALVTTARTRPDGSVNPRIPEDTSDGYYGWDIVNVLRDQARQRSADAEAAGERTNLGSTKSRSMLDYRWETIQKALPQAMKDPLKRIIIESLLPDVAKAYFSGSLDRSLQFETSAGIDNVQVLCKTLGIPFLSQDMRKASSGPVLPNTPQASQAVQLTPEQLQAFMNDGQPEEEITPPAESEPTTEDSTPPVEGHDPNGLD